METIDRKEAGRRLQKAREEMGISQTEAAEWAGISRPYLADMEQGKRVCSWTRLIKLVEAAGYDPATVAPEWFRE